MPIFFLGTSGQCVIPSSPVIARHSRSWLLIGPAPANVILWYKSYYTITDTRIYNIVSVNQVTRKHICAEFMIPATLHARIGVTQKGSGASIPVVDQYAPHIRERSAGNGAGYVDLVSVLCVT